MSYMKIIYSTLITYIFVQILISSPVFSQSESVEIPITIVIHGGAGTITRENMTVEMEQAYQAKLTEALDAGYEIISSGGNAIDAITEAIKIMENSPLFNAGKGAVFSSEGKNEMDASIMDGKTRNG